MAAPLKSIKMDFIIKAASVETIAVGLENCFTRVTWFMQVSGDRVSFQVKAFYTMT